MVSGLQQFGLLALPDGVLERVLACLELHERRRVIPLVNRRLQQLVDSPVLNAAICVTFDGTQSLLRLRSFGEWFAQKHGSVRQLRLHVGNSDWNAAISKHEAAALVRAVLDGCGGAGCLLQELQLKFSNLSFFCSGWASELCSLRTLAIKCEFAQLTANCSLAALTRLEHLHLAAGLDGLRLGPHLRLPASLTRLHLSHDSALSLPQQVSQLSRLRALSTESCRYTAAGYAPLAALPALRQLSLEDSFSIPACLPALTALESLSLSDAMSSRDDYIFFVAALPRLRQLTHLAIRGVHELAMLPPPAAATHTCLRSLAWLPEDDAPLRSGAWLSGLRHLTTGLVIVHASLPALAGATALEALSLTYEDEALDWDRANQRLRAVMRWAARHPSLRSLAVGVGEEAAAILRHLAEEAVDALRGSRVRLQLPEPYSVADRSRLRQLCVGPDLM